MAYVRATLRWSFLGIIAGGLGCAASPVTADGGGGSDGPAIDVRVKADVHGPADADTAGAPGGVFVAQDGTRLKARWMEGPDGKRNLWGWYDQLLKVPCRFTTAADGEPRCLPAGADLDDPAADFADAQCSTAAV